MKNYLSVGFLIVSGLVLVGCSETEKWTRWKEEVPLNTGETILVSRSQKWTMHGSYGAPSLKLLPSSEKTLEFDYRGVKYSYSGKLNVRFIAVSPTSSRPVLVGLPGDYGWDTANSYYCVKPYYVQLVPDLSGSVWVWPERIEPWLYGIPKNLMGATPSDSDVNERTYTSNDRNVRDRHYIENAPYAAKVDPEYSGNGCNSKPPEPNSPNWSKKK
jgi:hypothetical protein